MPSPTVHYAEGTQSQGNVKVVAVLADPGAAPSLAIINATTSVDLSLTLHANGFTPGVTTNKGTKPARLASKTTVESFNRSGYTLGDLIYGYDPQADLTDPDNVALATLTQGLTLYLVERLGKDGETAPIAIGDWVRVHKVILGEQFPVYDTTDENDEFKMQQPAIYATPPGTRVKVVA